MEDTWTPISGTIEDYTDTLVFEMSAETKKLEKIVGQALVAGEENSQYIKFVLPRYWDGIDIAGKSFGIEYALAGTYYGTSEAVNAEMSTDQVRFGWVVPKNACAISGTLFFVLKVDDTDYVLKSQIADTPVFKTIDVGDVVPEPTKEQWYREFEARVEGAIDDAEAAIEAAQAAQASAEAAAQNAQTAEDNAEAAAAAAQIRYGSPLTAQTAEDMIDENRVYIYTGSETGYTAGNWYYYDGSAWVSGGVYNGSGINTDTTLTQAGMAADAKAVGDELSTIKEELSAKVNSVKKIIALEATPVTYEMLTGKVIGSTGIVTNASGDGYKVSDYIPVSAGTVITCALSRARWGNQNWAFYDAEYNPVATYGKTASGATVEYHSRIIVPLKAKYFAFARDEGGFTTATSSDVTIVTKYAEAIETAPKSALRPNVNGSITDALITADDATGKVIGEQGNVVSTTSEDFRVSTVSVSNGDVINIRNCKARYSNKMYSFYDASGLPIYSLDKADNDAHDYMLVEVPFGAVTLAVSGYQSYATVSKVSAISAPWTGKKWAMMGDSVTEVNSRAAKRYFDYIAERTGITTVNLGLSGTGYKKEYNSNLPFYQRVDTIPTDSDVITIFGSGNDCSQTLGTPTDATADTVCGCINLTIDGIRDRIVGANIGVITPTPWVQYPTTTIRNNMDLYCDAIVEICRLKGVPCLDLYHCSNMLPWEEDFRTAFYKHDDGNGVHPDEDGHKLFAPRIKAFLETLLM